MSKHHWLLCWCNIVILQKPHSSIPEVTFRLLDLEINPSCWGRPNQKSHMRLFQKTQGWIVSPTLLLKYSWISKGRCSHVGFIQVEISMCRRGLMSHFERFNCCQGFLWVMKARFISHFLSYNMCLSLQKKYTCRISHNCFFPQNGFDTLGCFQKKLWMNKYIFHEKSPQQILVFVPFHQVKFHSDMNQA